MLGDISGYYVNNFKKMLTDPIHKFGVIGYSLRLHPYLEEANGVLGDLKQLGQHHHIKHD